MDEDKPTTIATIGHQISIWFGIVGGIISFICVCVLIGMWFGSLKDLPAQVNDLRSQQSKTDGRLDIFQIKYEGIGPQVINLGIEQGKLREDTKRLEVLLAQLSVSSVTKIEFLEWKSKLELRNKGIEVPQLKEGP
jgi:hypothetical protein